MTDFPDVKLKALVSFPATILDGTGIDTVRQNGTYQFNLAYDDFAPPAGSIPDAAHQNALLWNSITGQYVLVPVSLIASGSGAVSEAPNDGVQYGRQSLGWTVIVPNPAPATALPLIDGGMGVIGTSVKYAREDHVHPSPVVVTISDAPPSGAVHGQLWLDRLKGGLYVYYNDGTSSQWINSSNPL